MGEPQSAGKGSVLKEMFFTWNQDRYEVTQRYLKQLEDESAGSQETPRVEVKKGESNEHKRVKTEERNEPATRSRYFWLGEGADSDPRVHGMFPDRTYSDWESLESSDEVSESSETSSDSDCLTELYRMERENFQH